MLIVFCISACKKDDFLVQNGTIRYYGDYVDGGCEYVIAFEDSVAYKGINLPSSFEVEGLPVEVTYQEFLESPSCADARVKGVIYVHKIE